MVAEDLLYTIILYEQNEEFRLISKKWKTYYDKNHFPFNLRKIDAEAVHKVYCKFSWGGEYFDTMFSNNRHMFLDSYLKELVFKDFKFIEENANKYVKFEYHGCVYEAYMEYTSKDCHDTRMYIHGPGCNLEIINKIGKTKDEQIINNYFSVFGVTSTRSNNKILCVNIISYVTKLLYASGDWLDSIIVKNALMRL